MGCLGSVGTRAVLLIEGDGGVRRMTDFEVCVGKRGLGLVTKYFYGRYVPFPAGNKCFQPTERGVHMGESGMGRMSGRIDGGLVGDVSNEVAGDEASLSGILSDALVAP